MSKIDLESKFNILNASVNIEIKDIVINYIHKYIKIIDEKVKFNKFIFYNYWDGSYEDIHSYLSFGDYDNDTLFTESYLPEKQLEEYKAFFGDHHITMPEDLKEFLLCYIERVATCHIGCDFIIKAVKKDNGDFDIDFHSFE